MNSREAILGRISGNKPAFTPLPATVVSKQASSEACLEKFVQSVQNAGAMVHVVADLAGIGVYLEQHFSPLERILNTVPGINLGTAAVAHQLDPHKLASLEIAVIKGALGVAENGAVWVTADDLPARVLPFICEHLVLVISQHNLVSNMHEAYAKLDVVSAGYGVFIAGPSRTADIEQSLVIGAHGPKRAHVFILQN